MIRRKEGGFSFTSKTTKTKEEKKVDFELFSPDAKSVFLTGSFISWDPQGIEMKKDKKGVWKTSLSLKPGRYEYKFIVDGEWRHDPQNNNTVSNEFGTLNSVKEVSI